MNTNLTTSNEANDKVLINYLDSLGLTSSLTDQEKNLYLNICKAFQLNPFKREVHVSKYGTQMSIITGYEVYIKRAERSGQLDGWEADTTGSVATGDLKATVTIYRKDRSKPFVWHALYKECVQTTKEGQPTKFWSKAEFMTKKVAISQAFRLCFCDELGGMPYTADEIQVEETVNVPYVEVVQNLDEELQIAIGTMEICSTMEDLKAIWSKYKKFQKNESFSKAKEQRKIELEVELKHD